MRNYKKVLSQLGEASDISLQEGLFSWVGDALKRKYGWGETQDEKLTRYSREYEQRENAKQFEKQRRDHLNKPLSDYDKAALDLSKRKSHQFDNDPSNSFGDFSNTSLERFTTSPKKTDNTIPSKMVGGFFDPTISKTDQYGKPVISRYRTSDPLTGSSFDVSDFSAEDLADLKLLADPTIKNRQSLYPKNKTPFSSFHIDDRDTILNLPAATDPYISDYPVINMGSSKKNMDVFNIPDYSHDMRVVAPKSDRFSNTSNINEPIQSKKQDLEKIRFDAAHAGRKKQLGTSDIYIKSLLDKTKLMKAPESDPKYLIPGKIEPVTRKLSDCPDNARLLKATDSGPTPQRNKYAGFPSLFDKEAQRKKDIEFSQKTTDRLKQKAKQSAKQQLQQTIQKIKDKGYSEPLIHKMKGLIPELGESVMNTERDYKNILKHLSENTDVSINEGMFDWVAKKLKIGTSRDNKNTVSNKLPNVIYDVKPELEKRPPSVFQTQKLSKMPLGYVDSIEDDPKQPSELSAQTASDVLNKTILNRSKLKKQMKEQPGISQTNMGFNRRKQDALQKVSEHTEWSMLKSLIQECVPDVSLQLKNESQDSLNLLANRFAMRA